MDAGHRSERVTSWVMRVDRSEVSLPVHALDTRQGGETPMGHGCRATPVMERLVAAPPPPPLSWPFKMDGESQSTSVGRRPLFPPSERRPTPPLPVQTPSHVTPQTFTPCPPPSPTSAVL